MLTHLDLCSGLGQFAYAGAEIPGLTTCAFCEIDPYCQAQLRYNFPDVPIEPDIRTLDYTRYEHANFITAGFPCQNISIAGNGEGLNGSKSGVWHSVYDAVRHIRPAYIAIENTPELVRRGLGVICQNLAGAGYDIAWRIISAAEFGYPHRRRRILVYATNTHRIRRDAMLLYSRAVEQVISESQEKEVPGLAREFERLRSPQFWSHDYANLCALDNGYSHEENAADIHAAGNAVTYHYARVAMQATALFHNIIHNVKENQ
ncbi:MAG: DNA cytosine methyltransferase [Candidatus Kapabacteria bacterium]|nr:DNA cytosine methyltransferase [Candidatus Kapabacteria bacterium]